jgi:quinol monooxygenase YgiN
MVYLLVHHRIEDYKSWRPFFDEHEGMRKKNGAVSAKVFQKADDPQDISILFEWDSEANARRFVESTDLREVMKRAGVIGMPEATILKAA